MGLLSSCYKCSLFLSGTPLASIQGRDHGGSMGLLSSIGRSAVHIKQVRHEFWDLENIDTSRGYCCRAASCYLL